MDRHHPTPGATRLRLLPHGLNKDQNATVAGLTLPYSNGPTEGVNTKIKLLKRRTYGKASFTLLRKRILLTQ